MVVEPTGWHTQGGWHLFVRGPTSAAPILEVEIRHTTRAEEQLSQDVPMPDGRDLARWCAPFVEGMVSEERGRKKHLLKDVNFCDLDREFRLSDLFEIKNAIVEVCSLDEGTLDDLRAFWKVQYMGGCECPFCEGRMDRAEVDAAWLEMQDPCKLSDLQHRDRTFRIASLYGVGQDDMVWEKPFWLYQIEQAKMLAKSEAEQEREQKQENVKTARQMLQERLGV